MTRYELSADSFSQSLIIRKFRPVWGWERDLKFSASETGDEHQMDAWSQETLGL